MADEESVFESGENLQNAIGKALQEQKALLCFVSDSGEESSSWEAVLLDSKIRARLRSSTVALRLTAGSEQAGYLSAVCPIQSVPAVVLIFNAQVVGNYQHDQTTTEQLQQQLEARYAQPGEGAVPEESSKPVMRGYLDLPAPEGRMRLPNNSYDHLRKLTEQYITSGVSGKALLHIQLKLLESTNVDIVTAAVNSIRTQIETVAEPGLPDDVINRLLNTPASQMRIHPGTSQPPASTSRTQASSSSAAPRTQPRQPTSSTSHPSDSPSSSSASQIQSNTNSSSRSPNSTQLQRPEYIATQRANEAERQRIKAQIETDKKARREADRKAREEAETLRRRTELSELRKANSTTANPQSTDVRIQVRLFDGSTIRNSFAAESTISNDIRPWIDGEVTKKVVVGGSVAGQPYDLKLLLTPLPTRTIEAGEEDQQLADIEGVKGSATLVMVPVRGFVDSYSSGGGGVVGGVLGGVQSVVGAGVGLVGSTAGMVFGGLGRLMGAGVTAPAPRPNTSARTEQDSTRNQAGDNARTSNARVRTLADQRRDEDQEQRKRGTQLYNGMGLNMQPRKDDDQDATPK